MSNNVPSSFAAPKKLTWTLALASVLALSLSACGNKTSADKADPELAVAQRIQRVGSVELVDANRPLQTGEQVYTAQCSACHAAGLVGAPKFGDAAAWGPRLGQGYEALLNSALKGKNAMGAQGGGAFTDVEVGRAVVYMANAGGAKFPEPQAPAPAAQ